MIVKVLFAKILIKYFHDNKAMVLAIALLFCCIVKLQVWTGSMIFSDLVNSLKFLSWVSKKGYYLICNYVIISLQNFGYQKGKFKMTSKKTMHAIIKTAPEVNALKLEEISMPVLGKNDVLIKVKKTSICGTDVHIHQWDSWAQRTIKTPMVIGHEFVGTVVERGENVTSVEVGQTVSGEGHVVCGKCRHCITGKQHLCRQTVGIGVNTQGVFSEYIAIPATNVWICDKDISEDILSCLDPLGNAVHTALSFNVLGEDVLVTGAGPIGIMAVAVLKHAGARNIVITDVNPYRLKMAKEMGATEAIDVRSQKISDTFDKLKIKEGFDVGLEMSGNPVAFSDMINSMANGGKIAILGIPPADVKIDWNKVVFNSLILKGIYGREMYDTWYKMNAMLQSGLDKQISKVITHKFSYKDFEKGFEAMISGESGKVVLEWE